MVALREAGLAAPVGRDAGAATGYGGAGLERVEPVTWSRTAEHSWEAYERLLWS